MVRVFFTDPAALALVWRFAAVYLCGRGFKNAIRKYNEAIKAAADVPEALAPALLNRAMAEFKLQNYGRALQDVEKSLTVLPGNVKAHYRYGSVKVVSFELVLHTLQPCPDRRQQTLTELSA